MSLFVIVNHKTDLLLAMQKTIDGSFPDFSIFVQILKIRKSQKQIILFSYLPKTLTKKKSAQEARAELRGFRSFLGRNENKINCF